MEENMRLTIYYFHSKGAIFIRHAQNFDDNGNDKLFVLQSCLFASRPSQHNIQYNLICSPRPGHGIVLILYVAEKRQLIYAD